MKQLNVDQMTPVMQLLAESIGGSGQSASRGGRSVAESFREKYPVLLQYCQVATVEEVAPLWVRLANGAKGEQQSIIQQELTRVAWGVASYQNCTVQW